VTRARRLLILVGSQKVIFQMVENNRRMNRYTCLRDMLEAQKHAEPQTEGAASADLFSDVEAETKNQEESS
jgi:exodeoxyribonuclease V alpha subunit